MSRRRDAVAAWLAQVVQAQTATREAFEEPWASLQPPLMDLLRANALLTEVEADAAILRQRISEYIAEHHPPLEDR